MMITGLNRKSILVLQLSNQDLDLRAYPLYPFIPGQEFIEREIMGLRFFWGSSDVLKKKFLTSLKPPHNVLYETF
jgi:hypothetical protein